MIPLSVVIITLNEEKTIGRCLQSVVPIADEILIIDAGSTDNTKQAAQSFEKVRFLDHPFIHFGNQKRFGVNAAKFHYILSIDADEELSRDLIESVSNAKKNWNKDGYTLSRITCFYGKWLRQYAWHPELVLRLFDRRKGNWDDAPVHEKVIMQPASSVGTLKGDLLHYSYSVDRKTREYARIKAIRLFEEGKKASKGKILVAPFTRFFKVLVLKRGFLNGFHGLGWSIISAHECFRTYFYLWTLHRAINDNPGSIHESNPV